MIRMLPLSLDSEMFCLYDDARLLAKCLYSSETGEIFEIIPFDEIAAKPWYPALIKAVMSSMEYAGVTCAWSRNENLFPILKTLRYLPEEDGRYAVSLLGYFDSACECNCKKQ